MGGVIYKGCILPDGHEFSSDCKPWINPIIELVPVEDGE
ncbi:prophage pi3 protein 36 [Lactococcus lactis subsp. lactis]|nr:prophage pi3 protein 36 [Lactococcus lactis subsp. lactis]